MNNKDKHLSNNRVKRKIDLQSIQKKKYISFLMTFFFLIFCYRGTESEEEERKKGKKENNEFIDDKIPRNLSSE